MWISHHRALCLAVLVAAAPATAQSPLSEELEGLEWGTSMEEVLQHHEDKILEAYRTEIAGLRDPIEIDRLRRIADQEFNTIETSVRTFDGARTGFEVSVIQNEVSAGSGQALLSVRDEWSTDYYVFHEDQLRKILVTYDQASLNFLGFEAFVERLEAVFGGPQSTDWRVDDIGVRHMTRAVWEDGTTRARVEDKSQMFASYLLVYSDAALVEGDAVADDGSGSANRPTTTRNIGSMIRRMDTETAGTRDNSAVVDQILGTTTDVELQLRVEESPVAGAVAPTDGSSALDDEDELVDEERLERPSRTNRDDDDEGEGEEEEAEDEGGGLIY